MINKKSFEDMVNSHLSGLVADDGRINRAIESKRPIKAFTFKSWKFSAAAACLVLLLSLTALAAGLGYFDLFFGDKAGIISDNITEINKSVENNGIVFTIESAYTAESGGSITATFTKKDGSEFGNEPHDGSPIFRNDFYAGFPRDAAIFGFNKNKTVNYKLGILVPYVRWIIQSEDKKTLTALICVPRLAGREDIGGKNVKVAVGFLKGPHTGAQYEGPWEIEVTMPKLAEDTVFHLNYTTTKESYYFKRDADNKTDTSTTYTKEDVCTIEKIGFSNLGFFAEGTGDVTAFNNSLSKMEYSLKGESWFNPMVLANESCDEKDGKIYYYAQFKAPVEIKNIESLYMNGEEIPLK